VFGTDRTLLFNLQRRGISVKAKNSLAGYGINVVTASLVGMISDHTKIFGHFRDRNTVIECIYL